MIIRADNGLPSGEFGEALSSLSTGDPRFATEFVSVVLPMARDAGASDVHLDPIADAFEVRWRWMASCSKWAGCRKISGPTLSPG